MPSQDCGAHQIGYNSSLQIKMTFWHTFLKFELAGSGVETCCRLQYNEGLASFKFGKSAPNGHNFLQRAVTPDQIT
jgi:hypothetical protein